ncbi:MAG: hypothetical protein WC538_12660 [Thermoanaerobaculia bacterium]|jgi:hypothetical protein
MDPQKIMLTAAAATWVGGALVGAGLAMVRVRTSSVLAKGLCLSAIVVTAFVTPGVQDALLMRLNPITPDFFGHVFIDPGPAYFYAPLVVTILAAIIGTAIGARLRSAT